jgi:hypothetical protein
VIFGLGDAGAGVVPFLLQFFLKSFEADFFRAKNFELTGHFFRLAGHGDGFLADGGFLLTKSGFATLQFGAFLLQARSDGFAGSETLVHGGEFRFGDGQFFAFRLNGSAKLRDFFPQAETSGFGFGTTGSGSLMLRLREFGAPQDGIDFCANASKFGLAGGEFEAETSEITLHLFVAKFGGELVAFGFTQLGRQLFERLLGGA